MNKGDHLIWSNYHIDYKDWKEDMEQEFPDLSDDERYYKMLEINEDYLDDERVNLDIQLSQPILVIGSLGLWNGRHSGYREIESGNIRDCLSARHDYTTWYVDRHGDLRCDDIHHDGTNHYLYRVFKDGVSEQQRDRLKSRIYSGVVTRSEITRLTRRLGDEIGKVYGWRFPQQTVSREAR